MAFFKMVFMENVLEDEFEKLQILFILNNLLFNLNRFEFSDNNRSKMIYNFYFEITSSAK